MTEMAKTLSFVTLAVVSLVAAFVAGPSVDDFDIQAEIGRRLNQFEVEDAKGLRIVTFDKETASTHEFEVAEEEGLWMIPSKQGYPADAVRQMGAAATCLIDREVLRIAAENASQHAELGLVDPTASNLDIETVGVGIRVTLTDIDRVPLADMIIGKQVPETLDQHYVRNANQDVAYVVNLQTDALTTRFDDWIEKDLLKLYRIADDLRCDHYLQQLLEYGCQHAKGVFFFLEKYNLLATRGELHTATARKLRNEILSKDPNNYDGAVRRVAILDFQHNILDEQKMKPMEAISPLLSYIKQFGSKDPKNLWRIYLMISQYLFDKNSLEKAVQYARNALDSSDESHREEILQMIHFLETNT